MYTGWKEENGGFKRIEGWIRTLITFCGGTLVLGLATVRYIDKAVTASEQRTEQRIYNLKLTMDLAVHIN
ncbi:hypothetical protein BDZ91DRAFT_732538 [Kalaharituber pfeilii]|nr:hypothetical protein BDZ91DRAFT_732538 [Kalaharituber pfeilii]